MGTNYRRSKKKRHGPDFPQHLSVFLPHAPCTNNGCQLTRMQAEIDKPSSGPLLTATRSPAVSLYGDGGRVVDGVEGEELAKERLRGDQQQAEIAALKASIAQLHLEQAKSDGDMKEMQRLHRCEAQEREGALKTVEGR